MSAPFAIKICGLSTADTMAAALDAGADMVGLVFHPKSPRHVSLAAAAELAEQARGRAAVVALVVDADDTLLTTIANVVAPDVWQFHGRESFERIRDVRAIFGQPVIKAVGIGSPADLPAVSRYAMVADRLLLDAKPPADAAYPGGHGRAFDWSLLRAVDPGLPFLLSGGLRLETVGDAIQTLRAMGLSLAGVDLSSGVESAPGVKDPEKIRAFIASVRRHTAPGASAPQGLQP
jgi:phosphoribosylanthranilate isomerase